MSITLTRPPLPSGESGSPRRWTRGEVEQMSRLGILRPDEKFELIAGEIIVKMTQNKPHIAAVWKTTHALESAFGSGVTVLAQATLVLATDGAPEPDVMAVTGGIDDSPHIPTQDDVLLVVEVSDSTLSYDRGRKAAYYAEAGIADYWIVNLIDRCLEVRRNPVPAPDTPFGFAYSSRETFHEGETVAPLAAPQSPVAVSGLLPQRV
jgi:Uma2 family endonuclease